MTAFSGFFLFLGSGYVQKTVSAQQAITPSTGKVGLVGIAIKQEENTGRLIVETVFPNSPAAAAGVSEGDIIVAINNVPTQRMTPEEAGSLLRGHPNTPVTLAMERAGTQQAYKISPNRELVSGEVALFGVSIRQEEGTGSLIVETVFPNSPAAGVGVSRGDIIEAINGQSTKGMSPERAGELLRGQPDTEVALRLRQPTSRRVLEVETRRAILNLNE
ncbi:S41 family peptidase [Gloeocapsopsis dulcis]|nr:PDZ domain-containing protein [Gloeocapsopsis dulcis]WNN88784.1 PDZ domain-containing protein [Gloeocapsopsis dulcis]